MDILDRAFKAQSSLEAKQYHYVKLVADKAVGPITGANDKPIGILQNHPPEGGTARVRMLGESKLVASAAVALDAYVGTDNAGQAVTKTAGSLAPSRALSATAYPSGGNLIDVTVNTLSIGIVPA